MSEEDYMVESCKYCKEKTMIACESREYRNGRFVVSANCDNCGRNNQKFSNKPKIATSQFSGETKV